MKRLVRPMMAFLLIARAFGCGGYFEEAPPTLPFYLHRLPAKSLDQIYGETTPWPTGKGWGDYQRKIPQIAERLKTEPAAQLRDEVDHMLEQARFDANAKGELFNLLHDLRDALSQTDASADEVAEYIRWRFAHAKWFGLNWGNETPEWRSQWDKPQVPADQLAEIEKQLATASPSLRAHWIYLRGALGFKRGEDTESQKWFERVLTEFPQHPRAEAALFMDARCQISRSRTYSPKDSDIEAAAANHPRAHELFAAYLDKYPHGTFAADALGWLGAVAFDEKDYAAALPFYIQQTELPEHPELRRSALTMCEKVLSRIASAPEDAALTEVAKHPRLAMGLVYLIVNSSEADDFNGEADEIETVKIWRRRILPRLARAVAEQENAYRDPVWQPRYLAILAFAASGAGEQEQALRLTHAAAAQPAGNDDLLFARAVALQRARKFGPAIETYQQFLKNFGKGPLARGARLRLALTLQDNHQAGDAIVELEKLNTPNESNDYDSESRAPDISGAEPDEVRQLIDTLRNFAPLPELAPVLHRGDLEAARRVEFDEILAQRHLAREEFAEAKKYMPPAEWNETAGRIEALTSNAAPRAEACMKTAEAWAAARGKLLTYPLDSAEARSNVFKSEHAKANLKRRENAAALGFAKGADAGMEERDELQHAFRWWRKAAEVGRGSPLAATALWRALEAMPKIADVSIYTLTRANETDAATLSRGIYNELRRNYPASIEAKKYAAYWNFPKVGSDFYRGGRGSPENLDYRVYEALGLDANTGNEWIDEKQWAPLIPRILALEKVAAEWDVPKLRAEVADLTERARPLYTTLSQSFLINFLDDLSTFLEEPDPGAEVRQRYIALRTDCMRQSVWGYWPSTGLNSGSRDDTGAPIDRDAALREKIKAALADPQMKAMRDYLDFLNAAVVANHLIEVPFEGIDKDGQPYTYRTRDYPLLEKLTRDFLARYPTSRKREAALLLHARATFMESKPAVAWQEGAWPESGRWDDAKLPRFHERVPFEAGRILAALDDYDRQYPRGHYAAEIRNFRAAVAARRHNWKIALDLTLAQLHDKTQPALRVEAGERLAGIFAHLAESEHRADLLNEIKQKPTAVSALAALLGVDDAADQPIAYLKDYLSEKLGITR